MPFIINEDGIYNTDTFTVSCNEATILGKALADMHEDILIGSNQKDTSVYHAICAGILSRGKNIWNCGECTQIQLRYAIRTTGIKCGIYVDYSFGNVRIIPFSKHGFSLSLNQEITLTEKLSQPDIDIHTELTGKIIDSSTLPKMYILEAGHIFKNIPENLSVQINSTNSILRSFFSPLYSQCKTDYHKDIVFNISSDGLKASAYSDTTGFVFYEKLILICCVDEFEKGNDVPLPYSFPLIADTLAVKYKRNIRRYDPFSDNPEDLSKKLLSLDFPFLNDAISLITKIFSIMKEKSASLYELTKTIPLFTTATKYVHLRSNLKDITDNITKNNVCCKNENGRIMAKKSKSGKSLILLAESYSTETADELCNNWLIESGIK